MIETGPEPNSQLISKNVSAPEGHSQFISNSERVQFSEMLTAFENYEFQIKKAVKIDDTLELNVYDIDYYGMNLNALEKFDEGEFVLGNRLKFEKKYLTDTKDSYMYTHYTEIRD